MEGRPAHDLPVEELSDAIVRIDGDTLIACNGRARSLLGGDACGRAALPLPDGAWRRLAAGETVAMATVDGALDVRVRGAGGREWLLAGPPSWPEAVVAEQLRSARARLLGRLAGAIVHDLGNMLLAGVGLAETIRPLVVDKADQVALDELSQGTRRGSVLARNVAAMLARSPRKLGRVRLAAVVEDALTVIGKSALRRNVTMRTAVAGAAVVRLHAEEALQAIVQGALYCLENGAKELAIECRDVAAAVGGGRLRPAGLLVLRAGGLPSPARERACESWMLAPGLLRGLVGRMPDATSLVQAAIGVLVVGGEVQAKEVGGDLELTYSWPAAGA